MLLPAPMLAPPSEWVERHATLIRAGGSVLDVACGAGRHARFLAKSGFRVEAVDRDAQALAELSGEAGIHARCLDLEAGTWPYANESFDAIVVTNYLHRPLFPHLMSALAVGGVLIYETFALGNELLGRPRNPEYLLRPGELFEWVQRGMAVNAYEELCVIYPKHAAVQRICAIRRAG